MRSAALHRDILQPVAIHVSVVRPVSLRDELRLLLTGTTAEGHRVPVYRPTPITADRQPTAPAFLEVVVPGDALDDAGRRGLPGADRLAGSGDLDEGSPGCRFPVEREIARVRRDRPGDDRLGIDREREKQQAEEFFYGSPPGRSGAGSVGGRRSVATSVGRSAAGAARRRTASGSAGSTEAV